jgi:CRP-like cAMP-binding protein
MTTQTVEAAASYESPVAHVLAAYETIEAWPAGKVLFHEGTQPGGVYLIHAGDVNLCFSAPRSPESKPLLLASAGEILGLTSVMSDRVHDCTATVRTACVTGFIEKRRFLQLLEEKPALWLSVLQMISSNLAACWDCMRSLGKAR